MSGKCHETMRSTYDKPVIFSKALSQERVATAKNLLQHEEANLEKLVAEEVRE